MAAVGKDYYFFIKENFCSIKKHVLHFDFRVTAMQKFLAQMWKAAATSAHTFESVCEPNLHFYLILIAAKCCLRRNTSCSLVIEIKLR